MSDTIYVTNTSLCLTPYMSLSMSNTSLCLTPYTLCLTPLYVWHHARIALAPPYVSCLRVVLTCCSYMFSTPCSHAPLLPYMPCLFVVLTCRAYVSFLYVVLVRLAHILWLYVLPISRAHMSYVVLRCRAYMSRSMIACAQHSSPLLLYVSHNAPLPSPPHGTGRRVEVLRVQGVGFGS